MAIVNDTAAAYFNPAGLAHPGRFSQRYADDGRGNPKDIAPPIGGRNAAGKVKLFAPTSGKSDPSTSAFLPTAAVPHRYSQFSLNYLQAMPDLAIRLNSQNPLAAQQKSKAENLNYDGFMQLGIALDLRSLVDMPYDIPVVFGIYLGLNANGTVSGVPAYSETVFNFQRTGNNINLLQAAIALSVQPWKDRLSVGISPGASTILSGNAQVTNITLDSSQPTHVNAVADLKSEPAPVLAVNYRQPLPVGELLLGCVYRFAVRQKADFTLRTELPLGITQNQPLNSELIAFPDVMSFGAAYGWNGFIFMADLEYQRWSSLRVDTALVAKFQPLNFYDIVILRTAVESNLKYIPLLGKSGLIARLGYSFVPAYTPDQTGPSNYLDNSKHIFAFGIRKLFGKNSWIFRKTELDIAFQWQYWQPRDTFKSHPQVLADGSILPDHRYGGNIFVISAGVTWNFSELAE
ncbi:MAG: OmpP1/FadL family transporter [Spirochaetota bacterium]